ncbi:ribonuclease III [candidate division WOR-1 bacterium RIFOXYC2_FULL_37_10]|uniref:Ribonuclease 3 n=1 Tax=candidate division WOR-1 bacterium RIFOXYB2_FULL_37_13 TaxID=1802579 RepID=A0A1F4SSZ1_UNCSA|nr:MAG: ribonuclease III [candidate division WOR-1 bacterium RIFOXYB2_FULL_37_13]OGC37364.1 MAG: ribonuclease III [candidate division WOR-1 bacterium RIFOXYC2_FULL_37_10]
MQRDKELSDLERKLRIFFLNKQLLNQSLTHSSYANESEVPDNERLEFLGDAVIKLAVSEYIYNRFPARPEGDLTKIRADVISDETLARVATRVRLGEYLLLSENEKKTGGDKRRSNVANAFESLVGAIYLDAGLGKVRDFLIDFLRGEIEKVSREGYIKDYKSALQEFVQKKKWPLPQYKVLNETGPKHEKQFVIGVRIKGSIMGQGEGMNKKDAEQKAAEKALNQLNSMEKKKVSPIKGIFHKVKKSIWV